VSRLPKDKHRSLIGADDFDFADTREGVIQQQKMTTGYDCGTDSNCLQPDGAGYFIIPQADHSSWLVDWQNGGLQNSFATGTEAWALNPGLDWLSNTATPPPTSAPTAAPTAAPTEEDTIPIWAIIIIAVCGGLGLVVCVGGYMYYQQMLAQEAAIKAEKEALEKKKQALEADFDAANAACCGAGYIFNGCASGPEVPEHLAAPSP